MKITDQHTVPGKGKLKKPFVWPPKWLILLTWANLFTFAWVLDWYLTGVYGTSTQMGYSFIWLGGHWAILAHYKD